MDAEGRLSGMSPEWLEQFGGWLYSPDDPPEEKLRKVKLYKLAILDIEWDLFRTLPRKQRTAKSIVQRVAAAGPEGIHPDVLRVAVRHEAYASTKEVDENLRALVQSGQIRLVSMNSGKRGRPVRRYIL